MILQQSDLIIDDMRKERDALRAQVSVSNQSNCLCYETAFVLDIQCVLEGGSGID